MCKFEMYDFWRYKHKVTLLVEAFESVFKSTNKKHVLAAREGAYSDAVRVKHYDVSQLRASKTNYHMFVQCFCV